MCTWVLQRLADATLDVGRTVGIDATTLEANAAMRSIVRRCQRSFKIPPPAVQFSVAIDKTPSRRSGYALRTARVALEQLDRTSRGVQPSSSSRLFTSPADIDSSTSSADRVGSRRRASMSLQNPGLVSSTTDSQATAVGLSFPTREPHLTDQRDH